MLNGKNFEQILNFSVGFIIWLQTCFLRYRIVTILTKSFLFLQRFVANEFSDEHRKTKKKSEHFPSLILNESLFELKLIDLPVIPFFPTDRCVY